MSNLFRGQITQVLKAVIRNFTFIIRGMHGKHRNILNDISDLLFKRIKGEKNQGSFTSF